MGETVDFCPLSIVICNMTVTSPSGAAGSFTRNSVSDGCAMIKAGTYRKSVTTSTLGEPTKDVPVIVTSEPGGPILGVTSSIVGSGTMRSATLFTVCGPEPNTTLTSTVEGGNAGDSTTTLAGVGLPSCFATLPPMSTFILSLKAVPSMVSSVPPQVAASTGATLVMMGVHSVQNG
jgi:hypothetical protein